MSAEPFSNGANGSDDRDAQGRFKPGWRGGPGNPHSAKAREVGQRFDEAAYKVATQEKADALMESLYQEALKGNMAAAKLFLEFAYRRVEMENADRIDQLEQRLAESNAR